MNIFSWMYLAMLVYCVIYYYLDRKRLKKLEQSLKEGFVELKNKEIQGEKEMNKESFLSCIDTAIKKDLGIKVEIKMPDLPKPEVIVNPHENVEGKRAYYDKAYDDDLKLKTFDEIQIIGISLFS